MLRTGAVAGAGGAGFPRRPHGCAGQEAQDHYQVRSTVRDCPAIANKVFYRTDPSIHEVHILAIGVKVGNRLFIGIEEFEL